MPISLTSGRKTSRRPWTPDASENCAPCFRTFAAALCGSHSKGAAAVYTGGRAPDDPYAHKHSCAYRPCDSSPKRCRGGNRRGLPVGGTVLPAQLQILQGWVHRASYLNDV